MKSNLTKLTALLLIFSWSSFSCNKENDNPEKFRLIKITNYSRSNSINPIDGVEYTYDEAGNMIVESFYDYLPTTNLWQYREYEYLGDKIIKIKTFYEDEDDFKLDWYVDYFYEGNQIIKKEYKRPNGSLSNSVNYEYVNDNLVREYYYVPDSGIRREMRYTYDNQNMLIIEENDTFDDDEYKYTKYTYDSNDRIAKLEYFNHNWDLILSVEKSYNGRSTLAIKELHYDKNGVQISLHQHNYDKWGNLTETIVNNECSLFKRKYDGGLLIEEIRYKDTEEGCTEDGMTRYEYQKL